MLEPRRLAARQIAERMAQIMGEPVGKTIGYRVRFESKVSDETRIEVLTEGILTRMLVNDAKMCIRDRCNASYPLFVGYPDLL